MQNQSNSHLRQPTPPQNTANFEQENQTATFVISPQNTPVKSHIHDEDQNQQVITIEGNSSEENQHMAKQNEQEGNVENEGEEQQNEGEQEEQVQGQEQEQENEGEEQDQQGQEEEEVNQEVNSGLYETLYYQSPPLSDQNQSSKEENEVSHIQQESIERPESGNQKMESSAQLIEEQIQQHQYSSQIEHIYEQQGIEQEWRDEQVIFNQNRTHLTDFSIKNTDYSFVGLSNDEETPTQRQQQKQPEATKIEEIKPNDPPKAIPKIQTIPPPKQTNTKKDNEQKHKSQIVIKKAELEKTQQSSPQFIRIQHKKEQPQKNQNKSKIPQVQPKIIIIQSQTPPSLNKRQQQQKSEVKQQQIGNKKKGEQKNQQTSPKIDKKQQVTKEVQVKPKKKKKVTKNPQQISIKKQQNSVMKPTEKVVQTKQKEIKINNPIPISKPVVQQKKQPQKTILKQKIQTPKLISKQQQKPKIQTVKKEENTTRSLRLYYGLNDPVEPATSKEKEVKVDQTKLQEQQEEQKDSKQSKPANSNLLLLRKNKAVQKQQEKPTQTVVNKPKPQPQPEQQQQPSVKIAKKKKKKKVAVSKDQKPLPPQSKEAILPNTDTSLTNLNQGKKNPNPDSQSNDNKKGRHSIINQSRQPSQPSLPEQRNMVNIINSQLISSVYQSKLPPLTSLTIVKQAEKQRVGTTYKMYLKYTFQYIRTIQNYKRIVSDISIQLQRKKVNKKPLQNILQEYFENFAKLSRQFHQKCYRFQVQSQMVSASNNPFANIRLQLKKGFDEMVYLRKSIANNSNRMNAYINSSVLVAIKKAFQAYYSLVAQQQVRQNQRRQQHFRRQKIFNKVMSQLDKNFNKGLEGKFKDDLFIDITKFINEEKNHRVSLRSYGRGLIDVRHAYIKCEKELFEKLQDIINRFKIESRSIYRQSRVFDQMLDYTHQIKETTKFIDLCTLTDMDYIKYVLEIQNKKETNQFTNRHFQSYLDLVFFDRVVGNIRDMLKGATNKVFPMENANQELIHSISGNLVLFNRENDICKDKFQIKNVNAKIIGSGFVEFDQLIKGIIFDDNRTIRVKLRDEDRAQELICYLNQKEEDIVLQQARSQIY